MAVSSSTAAPAAMPLASPDDESGASAGGSSDGSSSSGEDREAALVRKPLPRSFTAPKVLVIAFGALLAACAGIVNVLCFLGLRVFVSHVTGTLAKVGVRIEGVQSDRNESLDVMHVMMLVGSFIFGAFLCGLIIPKNQVHLGGKSAYGVALLGNSCLLVASALLAPDVPPDPQNREQILAAKTFASGCLAAAACGLQNAMCTMHFGAIVRTTHVTGTATDIGSTAGRAAMILLRMRCKPRKGAELERGELLDDAMKLCVLLTVFTSFLCGAMLGAMLHHHLGGIRWAMLVPASVTFLAGLLYTFFRSALKRQLKQLAENRLREEVQDMDACLQRAHSLLERSQSHQQAGGGAREEDLEEIDEILHHSAELAHDVSATLGEICQPRALARNRTM